MATYWDIINRNDLTPEQKAQEIQAIGELERKQIDRENLGAKARIGLGATLQGVSALPVFNIPYVGTGLGGALFETGNAIMQGKTKEDIAKDAGAGFVVGETVGAIPYAGKVASKTKAGQAVGNQASKLFNYLTDTKVGQKVAEIAPKVEDLLMTDIKAFNPNKQTAYHGSPYDFAKFSNEAIGTGEGAQAHGMGHYAAKNKDVAQGYAESLSKGNKIIEYKGVPYKSVDEFKPNEYNYKLLADVKDEGLEATRQGLQEERQWALSKLEKAQDKGWWQDYLQEIDKKENLLNDLNPNLLSDITPDTGQLYKLSIPKDDVMLREDLPLSEQPILQELLRNEQDEALKGISQNFLNFKNTVEALGIDIKDTFGTKYYNDAYRELLENPQKYKELFYPSTTTGGDFYGDLANRLGGKRNATKYLQDKGIKGISYNGGIDGEARVIFNPDDIEIVRKYYNQPGLFQKLTGQVPNAGAVASSLYEAMTR